MIWLALLCLLWALASGATLPYQQRNYGRRTQSASIHLVRNSRFARNGRAEYARAHRKYGFAVPAGLMDVASSGSVPAYNQSYDREYLSPVMIGTPPQLTYMDFDTGSADFWTFTSETPMIQTSGGLKIYRPENSQTAVKVANATWAIEYGDGSFAAGNVYRDTVAFGGLTLANVCVESATAVSESILQDTVMSGIMGLALNHSSTVTPPGQPTTLDALAQQLALDVFAVDLAFHAAGRYDFGFVNETAYTGDVSWHAVMPGSGFWQFFLEGIHVGGTNVWYQHAWPMVADTGTTLMLLPQDVAAIYWAQVPGAYLSDDYAGWVYPCAQALPDFDFGFVDGFNATVPARYLNFEPVTDQYCYGGIQNSFPNADFGILGDVFLKAIYFIFDATNSRVGLAKKTLLS